MPKRIIEPAASPYLVPFDGGFRVKDAPTAPPEDQRGKKRRKAHEEALEETVEQMRVLQRALYAFDSHALLLVFQAMDAAGKDGTIRAVMSGINPAGCQVSSFKAPSKEELDHDFLWRTQQGPAGAGAHRHLQPLALRGGARGARPSRSTSAGSASRASSTSTRCGRSASSPFATSSSTSPATGRSS